MERLTTDKPQNNLQTALNLFYAKDGEAWVRSAGTAPEYRGITLFEFIRSTVKNLAISPQLFEDIDNETLAEIMTEWLFDGHETMEGIVATLFTAAWAFAEIRARLKAYEDTGLTPEEINKLDTQRKAMAALADSYKAEIPRWIPVSDRLPESSQRVIVCRKDGRVEQGVYLGVNGWWKVYGTNTKSITHWMPMPAPPEEV